MLGADARVSFPILTRDELLAARRNIAGERGSAHVSFPILTPDELTAAYHAITAERGCRWGDAVLYLMLHLCGTESALVKERDGIPARRLERPGCTTKSCGTGCKNGSRTMARLTPTAVPEGPAAELRNDPGVIPLRRQAANACMPS